MIACNVYHCIHISTLYLVEWNPHLKLLLKLGITWSLDGHIYASFYNTSSSNVENGCKSVHYVPLTNTI
jgi:hypothetical protein